MFSLEIALLGFALAVDAAVVTFAIGLLHYDKPSSEKFKRGLLVSLAFGFFLVRHAVAWCLCRSIFLHSQVTVITSN